VVQKKKLHKVLCTTILQLFAVESRGSSSLDVMSSRDRYISKMTYKLSKLRQADLVFGL